jgi:hypothetical protein
MYVVVVGVSGAVSASEAEVEEEELEGLGSLGRGPCEPESTVLVEGVLYIPNNHRS